MAQPRRGRHAAGFVFEQQDNPKNLIEVTPETFNSAMARTRQDYELSHGKQPNARMEGMSAKGGFHKNVMANNDSCDLNGKDMNKWTQPVHWGTNESRGTPGTVNGVGYGSFAGMAVLGGGGCAASGKRDCGIGDMESEAHDLADSGGREEDDDETVLGDEGGAAYDKRDCGTEGMEHEAHDLAVPRSTVQGTHTT